MKASDYVARFLAVNGVRVVTELCGGMTTHLLDSLASTPEIDIVSMRHEQGAAFAAEAIARMTGVPGVALATSGPGATNLLTGIGSCYFDSVPTVFITGQVNTHELRGESGVRQAGFQETDIVAIATPITKGAWQVESPERLPEMLERAFTVALSDRPGPVLLDIPMNVQRGEVAGDPVKVVRAPRLAAVSVAEALDPVLAAARPLVLAGGGIRAAGAADVFEAFVRTAHLPVVTSLMGVDALDFDHAEHVGLIGSYGNRWANLAMAEADCILVLGARLDVRQTGANITAFGEGKTIIRVDIDPRQLAWRVAGDVNVLADVRAFLEEAIVYARGLTVPANDEWHARIAELKQAWPDHEEVSDLGGINPAEFMRRLSEASGDTAAFVTDVGQNQMWAAQSLRLRPGQRFLTSGGMGAMGFALPAAIGAALVSSGAPVVMLSGDGGMQINIQELGTVAAHGLPLKMVVLNNQCLGMVRQFQDEYFGGRHQSTITGYHAPGFAAVASAYGIASRTVSEPGEVDDALAWVFAAPNEPTLLEVILPDTTCVRPKVSFGNPVYVMDRPPARRGSDG